MKRIWWFGYIFLLFTVIGIFYCKPLLYACGLGMDALKEYAVSMQSLLDGNILGEEETNQHSILFAVTHPVPDEIFQDIYDIQDQEDYWYFSHLPEKEKAVYTEILYAIVCYQDDVYLSTKEDEVLAKCFQCVLNDHPEIFYVNGYHYVNYLIDGQIVKISLTIDRTMTKEERDKYQAVVDGCVDKILNELPENAGDYEKAKFAYDYVIQHTKYDLNSQNNQNILSVFLDGRSVCSGYTKSVQYLLQKMDIPSATILGRVGSERHSWNFVEVNGLYYYIDATWGDSSYYAATGSDTGISDINYDYFLVTYDMLCKTHVIENVIDPPPCFSMVDNFYVREGLYFSAVSDTMLKSAFDRGYEDGWQYITLKCSSRTVYSQMKMRLLNNREVFRYLRGSGSVAYVDNETENTISFYL